MTLPSPDSVRVWRGFRLTQKTKGGRKTTADLASEKREYFQKLGNSFVPATVKMQTEIGLNAYIPAFPGFMSRKPSTVPDETAILFWETPQTYYDGFSTLAVRTYTLTHHGVYNFAPKGAPVGKTPRASTADFPEPFSGTITSGTPTYLFDQSADWMKGRVNHLVGAPPKGMSMTEFARAVAAALKKIQKNEGKMLDGAIACIGDGYLVYWELLSWDIKGEVGEAYGPEVGLSILAPLLPRWNASFRAAPTYLPVGLWDRWEGMDVQPGNAFNMQFQRKDEPLGPENKS